MVLSPSPYSAESEVFLYDSATLKNQEPFVGRQGECRLFGEIIVDPTPALVAVYGRRRVGKTFLVRRASAEALKFELTGIKDANLREHRSCPDDGGRGL